MAPSESLEKPAAGPHWQAPAPMGPVRRHHTGRLAGPGTDSLPVTLRLSGLGLSSSTKLETRTRRKILLIDAEAGLGVLRLGLGQHSDAAKQARRDRSPRPLTPVAPAPGPGPGPGRGTQKKRLHRVVISTGSTVTAPDREPERDAPAIRCQVRDSAAGALAPRAPAQRHLFYFWRKNCTLFFIAFIIVMTTLSSVFSLIFSYNYFKRTAGQQTACKHKNFTRVCASL